MKLNFSKFHGAGNDFIMIDNRAETFHLTGEQISFLCHRRYGIGADGLILLNKPKTEGAHFSMTYFNADGGEGTMCGNGGRSIVAFAHTKGICTSSYVFDAIDGMHHSQILSHEGTHSFDIRLQMQNVTTIQPVEEDLFLNTGSPHLVVFVDNAKNADAVGMGRMLRHDPRFAPGGTNVNFISYANGRVFVRTYERGVEDETLSCGTGITASALAVTEKLDLPLNSIELDALGGSFTVTFDKTSDGFRNIWLRGPVKSVFEGSIGI